MRNDDFWTRVELNSLNFSAERKFAVIGTILAGLVDLVGGYCALIPFCPCGSPGRQQFFFYHQYFPHF